MKGLTITFGVIIVIIVIALGISVSVYTNLISSADVAHTRGFEEGYSQGYYEGLKEGNEAGYQEGSKLGYLEAAGGDAADITREGSYFLYNPSYDQMMTILDQAGMTDAKDIHDYAEANGIRVAYVRAPIAREAREGRVYLYQLVAFETVDKGLVIIEPWSFRQVRLAVGESYSRLNGLPESEYDDTITKVTVVW
jgi:hypothetical protein